MLSNFHTIIQLGSAHLAPQPIIFLSVLLGKTKGKAVCSEFFLLDSSTWLFLIGSLSQKVGVLILILPLIVCDTIIDI